MHIYLGVGCGGESEAIGMPQQYHSPLPPLIHHPPGVQGTTTPNLRPHPSTQIDLYPANSPSNPISGFRTAGGLIGRAHRDLRAKTGCRNGTVGACLRQIQSLPHLDDLDGFATRL